MNLTPLLIFTTPKILRKISVMMIGLLCTSSALAVSYAIRPGYEGDMCGVVRNAFAEGMVLDAERPLCERRFTLSPKAKSLGLTNVEKELLPRSEYIDLLHKIVAVVGGEKMTHSSTSPTADDQIVSRLMKDKSLNIYRSNFDANNSGHIRAVYIEQFTLCNAEENYPWDSVTTYIQRNDGSLEPTWGVRAATAGIPYVYDHHTYYLRWNSLSGSADRRLLTQINIYDARPYKGYFAQVSSYNAFSTPICIIYQNKTRRLP